MGKCSSSLHSEFTPVKIEVQVRISPFSTFTAIREPEHRAISLAQLDVVGESIQDILITDHVWDARTKSRLTWDGVNLYHIQEHLVLPLTKSHRCSFVEVMATGPQSTRWFTSHWWGTPFTQTVELLRFHSKSRLLAEKDCYWICLFALNQHDLSDLEGELEQTPFFQALISDTCQGTVVLLDADATPFRRIWCLFETFVTTQALAELKLARLYDAAAWFPEGTLTYATSEVPACPTLQLDNGDGSVTELSSVVGAVFPGAVSFKAMQVNIFEAEATREQDKVSIIDKISAKEDSLHFCIKQRFAPSAICEAVRPNKFKLLSEFIEEFPESKNGNSADGASPIYIAASKGHLESLEVLLKHGADFNKPINHGMSPINNVAEKGFVNVLEALITAKADVNSPMPGGGSPIQIASLHGHTRLVELLLEAKADSNIGWDPTMDGYDIVEFSIVRSALGWAMQKQYMFVVKALEAAGAPAHVAAKHPHELHGHLRPDVWRCSCCNRLSTHLGWVLRDVWKQVTDFLPQECYSCPKGCPFALCKRCFDNHFELEQLPMKYALTT